MSEGRPSEDTRTTVYWMPHCSSCMAVKAFLEQRGVPFISVNVVEDPTAVTRLAARGIRSVPVVVRGDRFVFAQYLSDVVELLGLQQPAPTPLDLASLGTRLVEFLDIAIGVITCLPEPVFAQPLPGRERSFFVVGHHVFQIAGAAVAGITARSLLDKDSLAEPPADLVGRSELIRFAETVITNARDWRKALISEDENVVIATDYGTRPLPEVLHRVVSHVGQHTRQLVTKAESLDIHLQRTITPDLLEGLTLATRTFDD